MSSSPRRSLVIAPGNVLPPDVLAEHSQAARTSQIEQSRWAVLTVLFIVTGAFGLSLLWRSERFSLIEKCLWSVLVIAYTAGLFYGMVRMLWWSIAEPR